MKKVLYIIIIFLFNHTIVSCGRSEDGGSLTGDGRSSTTTISSDYNSNTDSTSVFGTSIFE